MNMRKWTTLLLIFSLTGLTGFVGCSSSSSKPRPERVAQRNVEELLEALNVILPLLDPFPLPPAPGLQGPVCEEYDVEIPLIEELVCPGDLLKCEQVGDSIEIQFNECAIDVAAFGVAVNVVINGSLFYTETDDWPTGMRTIDFVDEDFFYDIDFTNDPMSGDVIIEVTDKTDNSMFLCEGNLETMLATCEPIEMEVLMP